MFCKYCGTEIKNRDTFCANCGNPVNNTVDLKMQHRKRNNWNFIAALMFVAYALLSIMVSLIVWHSNIDMLDVLLWISYVTLVAILFINVKNLILVAVNLNPKVRPNNYIINIIGGLIFYEVFI